MTEYTNDIGPVEIIGPGPLSNKFIKVRGSEVIKMVLGTPFEYLVFADTMQYRADGVHDLLDVREVKVLSREELVSEEGLVSVVLEVKG